MGGSGLAVVIWIAGFTVTERVCGALTALALSPTVTEKLKGVAVATTGAVPESTPAGESVSHAGSPVASHVNGGVPPDSASVCV